jgi:hypothetical protein
VTGGWVVALLGLWMLFASLLGLPPRAHALNDWAVGVIVAGTAWVRLEATHGALPGLAAVGVAAGLVIAGFRPDLLHPPGLFWNSLIGGLALVITGFLADRRGQR